MKDEKVLVMPKMLLTGVCLSLGFTVTGCVGPKITPANQAGLFQTSKPLSRTVSSEGVKSPEGFSWPIENGSISSFYGKRRRDFHDGIDIRAPKGTPVHAAKAGEVIYSSNRIRGYGNMIVVKHDDNMATVYAHNRKNLVRIGDRVKDGQVIALVGRTGRATGPHLHFEVRKGEVPENPLHYLPQLEGREVAHTKLKDDKERSVD